LQTLKTGSLCRFFSVWCFLVFAGGFAEKRMQTVVFCMVNVVHIVVEMWWLTALNLTSNNAPCLGYLFLVGAGQLPSGRLDDARDRNSTTTATANTGILRSAQDDDRGNGW
jgi:hypothetical protein